MYSLNHIVLGCLFVLFTLNSAVKTDLEVVNDDELLNLIRTENHVVVLFTKKKCDNPDCEKFETELTNAREELVDNLNAWVVKAVNSPLYRLYSTSEPCILFFRMGVPLLYDGPISDEHIAHRFTENKDPVVKELTDENFEHLTQAGSGATTGDWFVMFYSTDCVECQRLQARWEAVGAELKTRMNVARINRQTQGRVTSRRFGVQEVPTFILFKLGKMYSYSIPRYDVQSFVSFAREQYRNARSEKIRPAKTPFDDLTQAIADYLKENPWVFKLVSILFAVFLVAVMVTKLKAKEKALKKAKEAKESKEKKPKKEKVKTEKETKDD
ncbi:hypothetical protein M8J77_002115 [Diaphorina citri]|nr:hypothetical protein M8J77_002115 [Diaphorina citri]